MNQLAVADVTRPDAVLERGQDQIGVTAVRGLPAHDPPGEHVPDAALTVTVGFGPPLFAEGRFGLAGRSPAALVELPAFSRSVPRTGCRRRLPWRDRPNAALLLAAIADSDRGFDAVVVGEYERAFDGDQVLSLLPLFEQHGVQLWLPEAHGPVNSAEPARRASLMLLGAQSKREVADCVSGTCLPCVRPCVWPGSSRRV
ncbi:Dyp-type peroxidase domain-containing protein [Dactylosporangium sp. NPDC049742]|uniref:Dyp-type peroxidase domain-containing protein n=1 Tax=Dactylosporangium sp. NPDC049742 TaxID=3154737 RepID=UPI0034307228